VATLSAALVPMTGTGFVLYTFYMITDPGTTPAAPRGQVAFGLGTAALYGLLVAAHVPYGMFFALTLACVVRGCALAVSDRVLTNRTNAASLRGPSRVVRDSLRPAPAGSGEA
jgi:hypothetical protein